MDLDEALRLSREWNSPQDREQTGRASWLRYLSVQSGTFMHEAFVPYFSACAALSTRGAFYETGSPRSFASNFDVTPHFDIAGGFLSSLDEGPILESDYSRSPR